MREFFFSYFKKTSKREGERREDCNKFVCGQQITRIIAIQYMTDEK